jgi:hypothetical protein
MAAGWDLASVVDDARRKEGLDDFAPGAFEEPLGVLLEAYAGAELNEMGTHLLRAGAVHSLRMRLRATEWFRRCPEIADEQVVDPVVVVGMMRSGTTLLQRLLAADPRFRCAHGWEVVEVAPRLDHHWGVEDPRIAKALAREEQSRQWVPDLYARPGVSRVRRPRPRPHAGRRGVDARLAPPPPPRDRRPDYTPETYGLSADQIRERFAVQ